MTRPAAVPAQENTARPSRSSPWPASERVQCFSSPPATPGSGPPAVLAHFKARWGEVDGYLPVLYRLKARHPDWRVIGFLASERMVATRGQQSLLYSQLRQIADVLISAASTSPPRHARARKDGPGVRILAWPRQIASWFGQRLVRWSWREVWRCLARENVRVILKDQGSDDRILRHLQRMFPAQCVAAPHGTGIYLQPPEGSFRKLQRLKLDLFIAGHPSEIPCFAGFLGESNRARIRPLGRPRYDQWWIEHLAESAEFKASAEFLRAKQAKRTFLFATRGPNRTFFSHDQFAYLVRSVAEVVLHDPGNFLLIKPHPQQDLHVLENLLRPWDPGRWMISSWQMTQLASLADLVVCMVSGVILDALAVGKPTIEFFQYSKQAAPFFLQDAEGNTMSAYNQLRLIVAAHTKEELAAHIEDCLATAGASARWSEQRRRAAAFLQLDNQSCDRVVDAIEQLLHQSRDPASRA